MVKTVCVYECEKFTWSRNHKAVNVNESIYVKAGEEIEWSFNRGGKTELLSFVEINNVFQLTLHYVFVGEMLLENTYKTII